MEGVSTEQMKVKILAKHIFLQGLMVDDTTTILNDKVIHRVSLVKSLYLLASPTEQGSLYAMLH